MIEIIPALIPQNLKIIRERFGKVLGLVKKVQMDISDGEYSETKTWPFFGNQFEEMIKMVRGEDRFPLVNEFTLEIDMLVLHPIEYISDFISIGAKSFVIHIDSTDHMKECIQTIKLANLEVGIGIKPSIDISLLEPYINDIDFVQFMGNDRVGHNGVELDESVIQKITEFNRKHPSMSIQIDIGVNVETVPKLKKAGVNRFISGSYVFNSQDPEEAISSLQNSE